MFVLIFLCVSRHILEDIGKDNDANFHMKLDKIKDVDYHKALDCLRRHLHVIECVLTKKYLFYPRFSLYFRKDICTINNNHFIDIFMLPATAIQIRGTDRIYVYKYIPDQH